MFYGVPVRCSRRNLISCRENAMCRDSMELKPRIAVKQSILGKASLSNIQKMAGDMNGDGKINITDFIKIKAKILGRE